MNKTAEQLFPPQLSAFPFITVLLTVWKYLVLIATIPGYYLAVLDM